MNQKLSDWASIAQIVSGFAVVVTLVFLVVGIRDNSAVIRASMYSGILDGLARTEEALWANAELSRLVRTIVQGETDGLDEAERFRAFQIQRTGFLHLEKAFFAREYQVIGDAEWRRMEGSICAYSRRMEAFGENVSELRNLSEPFRDFVISNCVNQED